MVVCAICGEAIHVTGRDVYDRIEGWQRRPHVRLSGKHGGSDIALREIVEGVAHGQCVRDVQAGRDPRQRTLV